MTGPVFPADALCAEVGTAAWFPDENDHRAGLWAGLTPRQRHARDVLARRAS